MDKLKPTPGPWFTSKEGYSTIYVEARTHPGWLQEIAACGPTEQGQEQQEANAELIAEAGTVYHECGLTPRELLKLLQAIVDAGDSPEADGGEMWYAEAVSGPIEKAKIALNKQKEV